MSDETKQRIATREGAKHRVKGTKQLAWVVMAALLAFHAKAVGVGVSPPVVHVQDGVGRLVVFNPSSDRLSFRIEAEGAVTARPETGVLEPWQSSSVLVDGQGDGVLRVLIDGKDDGVPAALPSVEVQVVGEPSGQAWWVLLPWLVGGMAAGCLAGRFIIRLS